MSLGCLLSLLAGLAALPAGEAASVSPGGADSLAPGDWPQFMRDSEHTGDASGEVLDLPLALIAQVKLDDAVLTSPAVVGGGYTWSIRWAPPTASMWKRAG